MFNITVKGLFRTLVDVNAFDLLVSNSWVDFLKPTGTLIPDIQTGKGA